MAWFLLGLAVTLTIVNSVFDERVTDGRWLTFKQRQMLMGAAWLLFLALFIVSYFL